MRGFIVAFQKESFGSRDESVYKLSLRLESWRTAFPAEAIHTVVEEGFSCSLFSECATKYFYNQVLRDTPSTLSLYVGPRLLWRNIDTLPDIPDPELALLSKRSEFFTNGMETNILCAYHRATRSVIVKTDLLNSTFIYIAQTDGLLLFSNSSLLLARLLGSALHPVSMIELVAEGNIYGHRSLYEGVSLLRPARFYSFDSSGKEKSCEYWRVQDLQLESIHMAEAAETLIAELDREFKDMHGSGRTMVFDLTGGYDSRCNVGMALRNKLKFRTTVSGAPENDDVRVAARVATRYGIPHTRVSPPVGRLDDWQHVIDAAFACTDGEHDVIEYAHVYNVHKNYYTNEETSVHGSTADLTRHYFFYPLQPYGHFDLDKMINKKFSPLINTKTFLHPSIAVDWGDHMLERISEDDFPELPAFARLNIIYLRLRMQFWQGRIASSTNRIHASFTPWTSIPILHAILTTKWAEMENRRLTRRLISDIYPGLDSIPMAGGSIAGVGVFAALHALPGAAAFYSKKVVQHLGRVRHVPPPPPRLQGLKEAVCENVSMLDDVLHPDIVRRMLNRSADIELHEDVLGKLYTLIMARKKLATF